MTPEQIAELERAPDAAGVRYRSEVYRGGAHGYTMADTPAYDGPRAGALIDRRSSPSRTLASAS